MTPALIAAMLGVLLVGAGATGYLRPRAVPVLAPRRRARLVLVFGLTVIFGGAGLWDAERLALVEPEIIELDVAAGPKPPAATPAERERLAKLYETVFESRYGGSPFYGVWKGTGRMAEGFPEAALCGGLAREFTAENTELADGRMVSRRFGYAEYRLIDADTMEFVSGYIQGANGDRLPGKPGIIYRRCANERDMDLNPFVGRRGYFSADDWHRRIESYQAQLPPSSR